MTEEQGSALDSDRRRWSAPLVVLLLRREEGAVALNGGQLVAVEFRVGMQQSPTSTAKCPFRVKPRAAANSAAFDGRKSAATPCGDYSLGMR
jgi:hypothetical protein